MDQDAFRKLLNVPKEGRAAQRSPVARDSLLPSKTNGSQPQPTGAPSKSEFKPRKIKKKTDLDYRDRAAERRQGVAGDFAEVEAVLENFEKQHADEDKEAVEKQRRYLGGDSEHTILVKGLDFALLEQTKARAAVSTSKEDDEMLEAAFHGVVSPSPHEPTVPDISTTSSKKRTREDIVRELKQKRETTGIASGSIPDEVKALEEAKSKGKFKPIGFKPTGNSSASVKDKLKAGKDKEGRKKKKRKVQIAESDGAKTEATASAAVSGEAMNEGPGPSNSGTTVVQIPKAGEQAAKSHLEPAPSDEDFDIFAEAGEYEGINFDDDDDDDDGDGDELRKRDARDAAAVPDSTNSLSPKQPAGRKWIDDDEPPSPPPGRSLRALSDGKSKNVTQSTSAEEGVEARGRGAGASGDMEAEQEHEAERPTRLTPLASSAVPSIRDILAADSALEAEQKRRARKEKRKAGNGDGAADESEGGKKVAAEAKLNRDYQKLKAYTEKKRGAKS